MKQRININPRSAFRYPSNLNFSIKNIQIMSKTSSLLAMLFLSMMMFQSCTKDKCSREMTYTKYDPVLISYDDFRTSITNVGSQALEKPGKIYLYDNYLFINEQRKGIHIFDNSDPSNPLNLGFITIPGNIDITMRNNILYADSYTDLLTINMTDPLNGNLIKRVENVFPYEESGENTIIGYYTQERVTETLDCVEGRIIGWENNEFTQFENGGFAVADGSNAGSRLQGGVSGSTARFALYNTKLYTVDVRNLRVFDLSEPTCPVAGNSIRIDFTNAETLFPFKDHLMIGGDSGVMIYSLTDPSNPTFSSFFQHATACDPVVAQNNTAYVTLRNGTECWGFTNQLDIIDVSSLENPLLINSFSLQNPHGLSIKGDYLFVTEGMYGFKALDVSNPNEVKELAHIENIRAFDIIALGNNLLVIGEDGLYQYDATNPTSIEMLSVIPVQK